MYKLNVNRTVSNRKIENIIKNLVPRWKSDDIAAAYQPKAIENDVNVSLRPSSRNVYSGTIKNSDNARYSSILPPPNVTGDLHLGHALMATIQDVILRWKNSNGYDVLWIPGTDHAGIATQVVVEKKLKKELDVSRHDIGKEAFLKEVWKWKHEKGGRIKHDLKRMGTAFNWEREYFTMDAQQSYAVRSAFIKLFDDSLIYRNETPVNWSCTLESAISDIEIENIDINGPTDISVPGYDRRIKFGQITDIAYKVCDSNEEIVVSTTRPESLLGDTAIAVHPMDERYSILRQRNIQLWHPFREEPIPLIFDDGVDPSIGTGAVKITPAHSKIDFAMAKRHSLPARTVINERGQICAGFGKFSGLARFTARDEVLNELANFGLLRETKSHNMQLPICSRSKDVIEHLLKPQWFVKTDDMALSAIESVRNGEIKLHPVSFEEEWHRWLSANQDWCISRQLWWGHQIPAFECEHSGDKVWVAAHNVEEAREKATKLLNATNSDNIQIKQDEDVLDTWFSSGLLPFSSIGWPNPSNDLSRYYPLDILETGHDIFLFWVAKMVMLSKQLTGQVPFKHILLHGIIRDSQGRKMSKSKGNVILPDQIINGSSLTEMQAELIRLRKSGVLSESEFKKSVSNIQKSFPKGIPECGTDALRFTLCCYDIASHFIDFDLKLCHSNKLFFNKIWQATRFTLGNCSKFGINVGEKPVLIKKNMTDMDLWILSRLATTTRLFEEAMDQHRFHVATSLLKTFFHTNFCDVYLETTKPFLTTGEEPYASSHCSVLLECLAVGMMHLGNFTPFLANELRQYLPNVEGFKAELWINNEIETEIGGVLEMCTAIRQAKSQKNIARKHEPEVYLFSEDKKSIETILKYRNNIQKLTLSSNIFINERPSDGNKFVAESTANHLCSFGITTNVPLESNISDGNKKKLEKLEKSLEQLLVKVAPEGYRRKVSQDVQQKHTEKIGRLRDEISAIKNLQ